MKKRIHIFLLFLIAAPVFLTAQERIQMTLEESGIYTIPCEVNGLKLRFVFDTGAADVHLSLIEAAFMLKNGYLKEDDFLGTGTYSMADGSIKENALVNLKTIKIGKTTIHDVTACISSEIDASLLLGQSAINKLGPFSIENDYLVLNTLSNNNSTSYQSTRDSVLYDSKGNVVPANYTGKGKKVYSTGSVVEASFKNGIEYGYGKYTSRDGKFWYEGNFDHGEANGKGKMYKDGSLYQGMFVDSKKNGKGTITYKNNNKYTGNFKDDKYDGYGTFIWASGDKYEGYFVNGYREGNGTYYWADGGKYEGYHVKGKFTGKGTKYYKDGRKYVGYFSDDKMEGQGTFTWPSGDKYVGNFHNGYRSGFGTYYWPNKDRYEGNWEKSGRTGKGIFYYSNGNKYEGDFVNGEQEGYGTFTWADGDKYVGNFKNGYRTGFGTYYWKSGDKHVGYWLNGKQDGEGTYYYVSGRTKKGIWKEGEFVSYYTDTPSYGSAYTPTTDYSLSDRNIDNSYDNNNNSYDYYDDDDYNYDRNYYAQTFEDVDYYLAQVTTDLNLRDGPGTEYRIISSIPKGNYVFLSTSDAGESFRRVLYIDKNIYGYVSKNYLINYQKVQEDSSGNLQIESIINKSTSDIKIYNNSNKTATISIGSLTYTFSPRQTRMITDIKPGKYKTMASAPGVIPYVGYDVVKGGYQYTWEFYIKTVTK